MANRLKSGASKKEKEKDPELRDFKKETETQVDVVGLLKDERTWKIVGISFIILSLFLFISFASYLFTWQDDQAIAQQGFSALLDNEKPALNWLGRLGAIVSHFFFYKAFGVASFLVCTFFFVVGVNLLFRQRVFSIWRNLKYVTIGVTVLSVSLSYIFRYSEFSFGGGVGNLIKTEMEGIFGVVGTGAVLFLVAAAYLIWQFNPSFKLPVKKDIQPSEESAELDTTEEVEKNEEDATDSSTSFAPLVAGQTLNELYASGGRPNSLKEETSMAVPDQEEVEPQLLLTDKEDIVTEPIAEAISVVPI
ncbi:MAG: hypothetical protein RL316_1680, partial [Bacteroidota bacterium]